MSDPIESAITAEENRQEEAFKRAHVCMDFCEGTPTAALQKTSLPEIGEAMRELAASCDNEALDSPDDKGYIAALRRQSNALRAVYALLSTLEPDRE